MPRFEVPDIPASAQRYNIAKSYAWNYEHAPDWPHAFRSGEGGWKLCRTEVPSPLGIAAGPLLNSRWVLHFAALGFDVLTYKTVRSQAWPCYPLPNLQPVDASNLSGSPQAPLRAATHMAGSWAVSFGMPSQAPDVWRQDVEQARRRLPQEKKLSVSVVATPQATWTIDQVGEDYARCAGWAVASGADFIELNFSCPNVASCDGQLYQNPEDSAAVAAQVRAMIKTTPLLIKIGHVSDRQLADSLVCQLSPHVDALVMVNCIGATVRNQRGPLFGGRPRGIAGPAIRGALMHQLDLFHEVVQVASSSLELVGVGGLRNHQDVEACLQRGATATQLATAVMWP